MSLEYTGDKGGGGRKERRERHILGGRGGGFYSNPSEIIFLLKIFRSGWTKPIELPRQPILS